MTVGGLKRGWTASSLLLRHIALKWTIPITEVSSKLKSMKCVRCNETPELRYSMIAPRRPQGSGWFQSYVDFALVHRCHPLRLYPSLLGASSVTNLYMEPIGSIV